jgi:hypothetical protein
MTAPFVDALMCMQVLGVIRERFFPCFSDEFLAMKHAGKETLDSLEELLCEVRQHKTLRERKRGAFYAKSAGILHFHEDPAGIFADLKIDGVWQRFPVNTRRDKQSLLSKLASAVRVR